MPDVYFNLSKTDQVDLLELAASKLGRPAHLLEKDIWVVWSLDSLFTGAFAEHLVFKGGTSLSKVYGAIDRFSEDIDITYDIRQIIPDAAAEAGIPKTRSEAKRWSDKVRKELPQWIVSDVQPIIQKQLDEFGVEASLTCEENNLFLDYSDTSVASGTGYVAPIVRLEFGGRATGEPADLHMVTCDVSDIIEGIQFPRAEPRVMRAERTFWEKATAIHVYCHQGTFRGGHRFSRHWHDLMSLDNVGLGDSALNDHALATSVATHKSWFFVEKDAGGEIIDYQIAVSQKLNLVPSGKALLNLQSDYEAMVSDGLLSAESLPFDRMMERISKLEKKANTTQ